MNVNKLTRKLISIPSYSDGEIYESELVDFLQGYIKKNLPRYRIIEQKIAKNRKNLFFYNADGLKDIDLLIINHTDTVQPTSAWTVDPLDGEEIEDKIFGLGASDTKGNVAALLKALESLDGKELDNRNIGVLLYCDEEYDFLGMKYFANSDLARKINPKWVMSVDGSGMKLGNGCRGLIEFKLELKGRAGHSANPKNGINTIPEFSKFTSKLDDFLAEFRTDVGDSTLNIAKLVAGSRGESGELLEQGNRISDYLEAIIEVRTASPKLNYDRLRNFTNEFFGQKSDATVKSITRRHDLGALVTPKSELVIVKSIIKRDLSEFNWLDTGRFGYLDLQMLDKIFPDAKLFSFGVGELEQAHSADEFNTKKNLEIGVEVFSNIIKDIKSTR